MNLQVGIMLHTMGGCRRRAGFRINGKKSDVYITLQWHSVAMRMLAPAWDYSIDQVPCCMWPRMRCGCKSRLESHGKLVADTPT